MTVSNYLHLSAVVFALCGWGVSVYADDDVTVVSPPAETTNPSQKTVAIEWYECRA